MPTPPIHQPSLPLSRPTATPACGRRGETDYPLAGVLSSWILKRANGFTCVHHPTKAGLQGQNQNIEGSAVHGSRLLQGAVIGWVAGGGHRQPTELSGRKVGFCAHWLLDLSERPVCCVSSLPQEPSRRLQPTSWASPGKQSGRPHRPKASRETLGGAAARQDRGPSNRGLAAVLRLSQSPAAKQPEDGSRRRSARGFPGPARGSGR